jgi:aminopeptidase N
MVTLSVKQTQAPDFGEVIYRIPIEVDIHFGGGEKTRHQIDIDQREQEFSFVVDQTPKAVIFDPEHVLLAEVSLNQSLDEEIFKFRNSSNILDRLPALQFIARSEYDGIEQLVTEALDDPVWEMRNSAVAYFEGTEDPEVQQKLMDMAKSDSNASVRATALQVLASTPTEGMSELASYIMEADSSYTVIGSALSALNRADSAKALQLARNLEKEKSPGLLIGVAGVYGQSGDSTHLDFFVENISRFDGWTGVGFMSEYASLLSRCSPQKMLEGAEKLHSLASNSELGLFRRYGSAMALFQLKEEVTLEVTESGKENLQATVESLEALLTDIKENETDDQLKQLYQQF